jgi:multidrug resistance efflux pump
VSIHKPTAVEILIFAYEETKKLEGSMMEINDGDGGRTELIPVQQLCI